MDMFCFQCEQTAKGEACTSVGVCGKNSNVSNLQDDLINSIIELVNCGKESEIITDLIIRGLFTTITNVNFDEKSIKELITAIKNQINCQNNFNIKNIWNNNDDTKSLKALILFGLKGMAAYAYHAKILGYEDKTINSFFYKALRDISKELSTDELFNLALKVGEVNLKCMELLDKANTETYGQPVPTKITTNILPGPFIVISGHDLRDLELLLEQTKNKGINIYTHGEMLPCHSYPRLNKYPHLKGNFGTAWQNQQKEFDNIPGAILFTTNCIMPVKNSYADRVFTTSIVHYPNITHIGEDKNFEPVIEKALELGGYNETQNFTGINGGNILTSGFAHNTVLSIKDKILEAINSNSIKHIFLVGGCDGAKTGRNYYTNFVKQTPDNSIVLTLACGKYRFNDLDLKDINGIPRLLDLGQCNDAYSAIKIAVELAKSLNCSVNNLPLSIILSWYEQKAVCILLSLLYLGIENIRLGPTLPAFVSPNIWKLLVEKFKIKQISTPENDLKDILSSY